MGLTYSEAAALLIIHRGVSTVNGLAEALNVSAREAEQIVAGLEARGLVERVRGGLLRREKLRLTRRGLDAVPEAAEALRRASEAAVRAAEEARRGGRPDVDDEVISVLPALAFLGLIPLWVTSILAPIAAAGAAPAMPAMDAGGPDEAQPEDSTQEDLEFEVDDLEL